MKISSSSRSPLNFSSLFVLLLLAILYPSQDKGGGGCLGEEEVVKPWSINDVVFNASLLGNRKPFIEPASLFGILRRDIVDVLEWGCLSNTAAAKHSVNKWSEVGFNRSAAVDDPLFLKGTTMWINEHQAVGHMYYDVYLIQMMQTIPIDRIIWQRAPCVNAELCYGVGTFDGWYMGYFTAMMEAFNRSIPLYIRWYATDTIAKPLFLHPAPRDKFGYSLNPPSLPAQYQTVNLKPNYQCFERVIKRRCPMCFHRGISTSAVHAYKKAAYALVRTQPPPPLHFKALDEPIIVTLAYRGESASRHIQNIQQLISCLNSSLAAPMYKFNIFPSTNNKLYYYEQIDLAARSHIIICEHGAFQSNIMFMRKGALVVEMRGDYYNEEFFNFHALANLFEVYYTWIVTKGLTSHHSRAFDVSLEECGRIADIVHKYAAERPYRINMMQ